MMEAASAVARAGAEFDAVSAPLRAAVEVLSEVKVLHWPATGSQLYLAEGDDIEDATLLRWGIDRFAVKSGRKLSLSLLPAPGAVRLYEPEKDADGSEPSGAESSGGLRYRTPVRGVLRVCEAPCGAAAERWTLAEGAVPQLGRLFVLPFHNGPFQSNELKASFAENGTMVSYGYAEKTSRAEGAAATLQSLTTLARQLPKDLRTARGERVLAKTQEDKDLTALFTADTELRKALLTRKAAYDALTPDWGSPRQERRHDQLPAVVDPGGVDAGETGALHVG